MVLAIGEISNLEFLHLLTHKAWSRQHHGNDNKCGGLFRNSNLIVHLRQQLRRERGDQQRMQCLYGEFAQRKRRETGKESKQERLADSSVPRKIGGDKTKGN